MTRPHEDTQYGFDWGPLRVERIAHDDRIGWVIQVRPRDAWKPRVDIRVSPAGRTWGNDILDSPRTPLQ